MTWLTDRERITVNHFVVIPIPDPAEFAPVYTTLPARKKGFFAPLPSRARSWQSARNCAAPHSRIVKNTE